MTLREKVARALFEAWKRDYSGARDNRTWEELEDWSREFGFKQADAALDAIVNYSPDGDWYFRNLWRE